MKTIKVIGIGNSGISVVRRMIKCNEGNIDYCCMDTDLQSLNTSLCKNRIQLGVRNTKGFGAKGNIDVGVQAAIEANHEIIQAIEGADMVFIVSGMGGGTGTGASAVVSKIARNLGIHTIGVISEPFSFEGPSRYDLAKRGTDILRVSTDSLYVIHSDNLLPYIDRRTRLCDSFMVVDECLSLFIGAIVDISTRKSVIDNNYIAVGTILSSSRQLTMGIGRASGEERSTRAAEIALNSQLFETPITDVSNLILIIKGGHNMTSHEIENAINIINKRISDNVNIVTGAYMDDNVSDEIQMTVIGG